MSDTSNYRPVAVARVVSKLLEHFILSNISPFHGTVTATSSHNMNELENVSKGDSDSQKIVVPESGLKITRV